MKKEEFREFIELIDKVFGTEGMVDFDGDSTRFIEGDGNNPAIIELCINPYGQLLVIYNGRCFYSNWILIRSLKVGRLFDTWQLNVNENFYLYPVARDSWTLNDVRMLKIICDRYNEEQKEEEDE